MAYGQSTITPTAFDYSRPYDLDALPPDQAVADASVDIFDSARASFKEGNYAKALTETDQAIVKLPNDTAIQEFRALIFFALRDYDRAAAVLYSVLSVGPGWDWTTLIGLYPDVETYTAQLRALEAYRDAHPDSAPAPFVLAYHYMSSGYTDAAEKQLQQVVRLKPSDRLSAEILKRLTTPASGANGTAVPAATAIAADAPPANPEPPADATPAVNIPPAQIVGTWTASPADGVTITLNLTPDNKFTWGVKDKGGDRSFAGTSSLGSDILTLAPPSGTAMVGKISLKDANQFNFNFKALGAGSDDPGLNFKK